MEDEVFNDLVGDSSEPLTVLNPAQAEQRGGNAELSLESRREESLGQSFETEEQAFHDSGVADNHSEEFEYSQEREVGLETSVDSLELRVPETWRDDVHLVQNVTKRLAPIVHVADKIIGDIELGKVDVFDERGRIDRKAFMRHADALMKKLIGAEPSFLRRIQRTFSVSTRLGKELAFMMYSEYEQLKTEGVVEDSDRIQLPSGRSVLKGFSSLLTYTGALERRLEGLSEDEEFAFSVLARRGWPHYEDGTLAFDGLFSQVPSRMPLQEVRSQDEEGAREMWGRVMESYERDFVPLAAMTEPLIQTVARKDRSLRGLLRL